MSAFLKDSFPRTLIVTNGTLASSGTSADLTSGQIGAFDAHTHALVTAANSADHPQMYFAQGSFYSVDTIGGGVSPLQALKMSNKTPYINAKFVSKFYKQAPKDGAKQILVVDSKDSTASKLKFVAGKAYTFRFDIQGTPVLRILGRQQYRDVTVQIGCPADDCAGDCDITYVDPALVYKDLADQINSDPTINQFIKATALVSGSAITDSYVAKTTSADIAAVAAGLKIEVGYDDTVFGDCSYSPIDYKAKDIMVCYVSSVRSFTDLCAGYVDVDSRFKKNVTETQAPVIAQGLAESVIKDYLLSREYRGLGFSTDPRTREIEKDPLFSLVDRTKSFYRTYLEYNVPTMQNADNTFSTNRFLYCFAADSSAKLSALETFISAWLEANNSPVTLDSIS